jgi:hypothetical protein
MLDPAASARSVHIRQLEGWSEAACEGAGGSECLRNVFCEHLLTAGVWSAVVKVVASKVSEYMLFRVPTPSCVALAAVPVAAPYHDRNW